MVFLLVLVFIFFFFKGTVFVVFLLSGKLTSYPNFLQNISSCFLVILLQLEKLL